jgi:cyclase
MNQENFRIIARLDIKGTNLIKSVNLEGLRVIGDPNTHATEYYKDGIDEIIYIDCVASLYGRNQLVDLLKKTVKDVFIPITAGGGIRTLQDARELLRNGADKIAINTAAVENPDLIKKLSREFGSQCVVSYIEVKKREDMGWEVFVENGRQRTYKDVLDWAEECAHLGAGEILLTSIDKEGTATGFDLELCSKISYAIEVPIIASGGMGKVQDLVDLRNSTAVSGAAIADVLHYKKLTVDKIKVELNKKTIPVRIYA